MRLVLRTLFALALLLGSGAADWAPVQAQGHEACCCGTPTGVEDSCPCPKPEGNRTPSRSTCQERQAVPASQAALRRVEQGQRRSEPRSEPPTWARAEAGSRQLDGMPLSASGRDPDLGRHLARLSLLRI